MAKDITTLLGRQVVVVKNDRYMKRGTLKSIHPSFIVLEFSTGEQELIGWAAIDNIKKSEVV